ncbi:porin [Solimicrobium silvestre]|uniref:Gram-negative porin n=1 Tax=Solimicrobium silvestre TaxID=2099400 RepID=A0A2S9GTR9_9BURK|nr:porin [Solimicrobium silvestre]PRC91127.1 Gram-negative porin [Solimicrobium silvestre]
MNYKHFAIGLVSLASGVAHAQSSTTIYGVIDAGTRYSSGLGLSATSSPSASNASTTGLASGVDRSGRFGFTGTEDLGGGYQALFKLESDLYTNTGSTNANTGTGKDAAAATTDKFFEREASVGIATPFGKVLFGRQQSVIRDIIDEIDAIDGRFTGFNPNLQFTSLNSASLVTSSGTYYGTGDPGNGSMMRQDNAVKYIAQSGPVTGTLLYSFGGVAGSTPSGSSAQAGLSYRDGGLVLSAAYENLNNNNDTLKLTAYTAGGRYTFGDWQIAANYGSNSADNTPTTQIKTDIYSIGTTYAATSAIDLTLGYYNVNRTWTNDVKPDATINRVIGFAEYKFSKSTLVYLELDHNKWGGDVTQFQGGAANKSTTTGFTIGINHQI